MSAAPERPVLIGFGACPSLRGPPSTSSRPFTRRDAVTATLVHALSNVRDGQIAVDGGGFAMFVLRWDGQCHRGEWSAWGRSPAGRGTFRLCPL